MKQLLCYLILFLCLSQTMQAQNLMLDSLVTRIEILSKEKPSLSRDTTICLRLSLLTERCINLGDKRADFLLDSLRNYTQKLSWNKGKGLFLRALGKKNDKNGNYTVALNHYTKAIDILEKAGGDPYELTYTYILAGFVLNNNGLTDKCKIYMEKALPLAKKTKNSNNLCWILDFYGDYNYYDNFGVKNYRKALQYYLEVEKNLPNATSVNIKSDNAHCLANVYLKLGDEKKANFYRDKALKIAQESNNRVVIFAIYADLADIYEEKKEYEEAIHYRKLSLEYAHKSEWKEMISRAENSIFQTYKIAGNADSALKYFELFKSQEDSLGRVSVNQKYAELETKYNSEKQIAQIKELQNKNLLQIRNSLLLILLLGIVLIAYIFWNNQKLKKKNEEIQIALLQGQTMERKRMASELHDNISNKILGVKMRVELLENEHFTEKDRINYNATIGFIEEVYADIRLVSHNLLPEELEINGLGKAIENLVKKLNLIGKTHFDFQVQIHQERFPARLEYEIYSIILELVNNTLKHAQAENAIISIIEEDNQLKVSVKDNGKGFDSQAVSFDNLGLKNIRSRIESLRGKIKIESNDGTDVWMSIPI